MALWNNAEAVARLVENHTHRLFYPRVATRYFHGHGGPSLRVGHLITITAVSVSQDDGQTYTALAATDYYATVEHDPNGLGSYTHLEIDVNGDYTHWYRGQKSVKVEGVWGYVDDRAECWESSGDTVEDNPLSSSATGVTVNNAGGNDLWGRPQRFQVGQLWRIESEYVELTALASATGGTVARGRNGSTAAAHVQNTAIDIWRPPAPVKLAATALVVRSYMRAVQGYADGRASPEISQMVWVRAMDPDAVNALAGYTDMVHA